MTCARAAMTFDPFGARIEVLSPRKDLPVARYMVERHLPGFTAEQLLAAADAAKTNSAELARRGAPIRYLRSTFVPAEEKCYCLFEGPSEEAVREVQERAGLPYERIHEAVFVTADEVGQ